MEISGDVDESLTGAVTLSRIKVTYTEYVTLVKYSQHKMDFSQNINIKIKINIIIE
jgi:hypothetical protein